jgi:hypothetical protein
LLISRSLLLISRYLLLTSRSLLPDTQASFDTYAYLRYASISVRIIGLVGLFCVYNRFLLPYGRPLLTLPHTHTSGVLAAPGRQGKGGVGSRTGAGAFV